MLVFRAAQAPKSLPPPLGPGVAGGLQNRIQNRMNDHYEGGRPGAAGGLHNRIDDQVGLWPPDYDQPLYIRTDACAQGLGAYLFQMDTYTVE